MDEPTILLVESGNTGVSLPDGEQPFLQRLEWICRRQMQKCLSA